MSEETEPVRCVDPYLQPAHDRWVESGHCDSISRGKAWCNHPAGHTTPDHYAPRISHDGSNPPPERWTTAQEHTRPVMDHP